MSPGLSGGLARLGGCVASLRGSRTGTRRNRVRCELPEGQLDYFTREGSVTTRVSYREIVKDLLAAIRSGELSVGDQLPRERQLAERYGAAVGTVRRAMTELQAMGVSEGRRGSGNYVRKVPVDGQLAPAGDVDHLAAAQELLEEASRAKAPEVEMAKAHALVSIAESLDRLAAVPSTEAPEIGE